MARFLVWTEGDGGGAKGWACSECAWKDPIPTLLSEGEARSAYDRLAAVKFREHTCLNTGFSAQRQSEPIATDANAFADRARALIKRGYTPKIAVDLVLHELEIEYGGHSPKMDQARVNAGDFLRMLKQGRL
ncbi:MAG TPA: hypothetical protein VK828_04000 [Terriglobales bacterium]|jgi:hypothetical protein|nr:hypothetical protein [Terriglobales bacterium]